MSSIIENLNIILEKIENAKSRAGIKTNVKLVAVSKTKPSSMIREAFECGHTIFGENKVQEGIIKREELKDIAVELHLIGHLQTNKAKKAVETFDYIHSVDSLKLAKKLSFQCEQLKKEMPILIQVNTSGEKSKSGIQDEISQIRNEVGEILELPYLKVQGFMTIGPLTSDLNAIRNSFIELRTIRDKMKDSFKNYNFNELSMGMSSDFEIAVEEGATFIRVGSLIFGARNYH